MLTCSYRENWVFDIVFGLRAGRSRIRIPVVTTDILYPKTSRSCTSAPLRGIYGTDRENLTFYLNTLHILRTKKWDNDVGCSHIIQRDKVGFIVCSTVSIIFEAEWNAFYISNFLHKSVFTRYRLSCPNIPHNAVREKDAQNVKDRHGRVAKHNLVHPLFACSH